MLWTTFLSQYGSIFNHFYVIGPNSTEFGEIMQNNGHSTSLKVTNFGTNRKSICDFLLVINTNLHPILHHFQVIADYWSNLHFRWWVPLFNTLVRGEPLT